MTVLEASGPQRVFMHPEALTPKYAIFGQVQRFIGIPFSQAAIEGASLKLELSKEPVEVMPGVNLTGEVPRVTDFEGLEPNLFCFMDGDMVPDPFLDDQALVVDTPEGAIVLTGCAHSGVVNILKHVLESHERIRAVVGGTHLGLGDAKRMQPTIEFLDDVAPDKMIFTHCTGAKAAATMMERFKDRFVPSQKGLVLNV